MKELHVFDFDGTLFRSPHPPEGFTGDWWDSPESLGPPYVPKVPDSWWWVPDMISEARKSIQDPNVFSIVLTGRWNERFGRTRIPELLTQQGLFFDEIHCSDIHFDIRFFKAAKVKEYLLRFPTIIEVKVWDDVQKNLDTISGVVVAFDKVYTPVKVQAQ